MQQQKQKLGSCGVAGWVRLRGRRKYVHVASVAPSMALTPRNRTHPAFDNSPQSAVDPRQAWMLFDQSSN